jgi:hypothetical protein
MKNNLPFMSLSLTAQINKIEPPFWYAGMQNPELQILFYGENIALMTLLYRMQFLSTLKKQKTNYLFHNHTKNIPASDLFLLLKQQSNN